MFKVISGPPKKILVVSIVTLFLVSMMFFISPNKIYADTEGDFTYTITDGKAQITRYTGGATVLTIPSTLGGVEVTSIGLSAFINCDTLTSVTIPESVISIGNGAFTDCNNITTIIIPNSVTFIDDFAFLSCTSLATISIPESVISIGKGAFFQCDSLTSITFNSATTTIYDYLYTIPEATKIIGYDPSTAKDYATTYSRTFEALEGTPTPAPSSTSPRPLTPEERVLQNLTIGQQANLYGSNTTGFVKTLYDNILGRVTDEGGLNDQVTALNNGMTPNQIVFNLVFSDELNPKISSMGPQEFVIFMYKNVFNRDPDPNGYNNWVSLMQKSVSKKDALSLFLNSGEFNTICRVFGLGTSEVIEEVIEDVGYYVLFLNDNTNTFAKWALGGINHGHVALLFYTTDQSSKDLYWSFGSGSGSTLERHSFDVGSTNYAWLLANRSVFSNEIYVKFLVFKLDKDTYTQMLGYATNIKMLEYKILTYNCLTEASRIMSIGNSYFYQYARDFRTPNVAFDQTVKDYKTYYLSVNGLDYNNFKSTIINHAIPLK